MQAIVLAVNKVHSTYAVNLLRLLLPTQHNPVSSSNYNFLDVSDLKYFFEHFYNRPLVRRDNLLDNH